VLRWAFEKAISSLRVPSPSSQPRWLRKYPVTCSRAAGSGSRGSTDCSRESLVVCSHFCMKRLTTRIADSETGVLPEKRENASASQTVARIPAPPNIAASVAVIATSESESFAMPPALAPALPNTYASRQRALRPRWPWSLSALGNTFRHCLQRWDAGIILEGPWGGTAETRRSRRAAQTDVRARTV